MIRKIILTILLLIPFLIFTTIDIQNADKIYPRVFIGTIDVGGMDKQQFAQQVTQKLNQRVKTTITIEVPQEGVKGLQLDTGIIRPDIDEMYRQAYRIGREKSFATIFWEKVTVLIASRQLEPAYDIDDLTIDTILADKLRPYERETINSQIKFERGNVFATISKPGKRVNRQELVTQIKDYLLYKSNNTALKANITDDFPQFTQENTRNAIAKIRIALSRPLTIQSSDGVTYNKTLDSPQIFDLLQYEYNNQTKEVEVYVANFKLAEILQDIPSSLDQPASEGRSEIVAGVLVITEQPKPGKIVDTQQLTNDVTTALFDPGRPKTVSIPVKEVQPALTNAAVNKYGIRTMLATGTSYFRGSSPARVHNIKLAVEKLNGALISPGSTFSMYQQIGDIERSSGYTDSAVIKNGRTILGIGGGVCQVSTTLFRAALLTGLPIVERRPHSYRVGYYEQQSPPGLDAAIYFPQWDLKFTNDTQKHILVQTILEEQEQKLTINFWGESDGRQVSLSEATLSDQRQPPQEVRIESSTIPKGTIRQTEFAAEGAKVTITRIITKGDQKQQDQIVSQYRPWQSVILIGTGTP